MKNVNKTNKTNENAKNSKKNNANLEKQMQPTNGTCSIETAKPRKIKVFNSIIVMIGIALFVVSAILVFQLLFDNGVIPSNEFYDNTSINGVDVSGMSKGEAAQLISTKLLSSKDEIEVKLKYQDKEWVLKGSDFEYSSELVNKIDETFMQSHSGTVSQKVTAVRNIKTNGLKINLSYRYILKGFDEKIDEIIKEINVEPQAPEVVFKPNDEVMFSLSEGNNGIEVDRNALFDQIDNAFRKSRKIEIEIPIKEIAFKMPAENPIDNIVKRSVFSTDYSSSIDGRKNNVNRALLDFNGMVVKPGEEVSFNTVTGDKTPEKGYQKAKIILNGVYVDGYGGGACQASTTLYNALILADIEILEVNPHSLPVSYVPLAFDAMVSEGYSDLRFKNNLENPIYIKTWGDETRAYVEIYGEPFEEGLEIKRRAEFIGTIPHEGDTIIKDTEGEYADKITYAGEYLRIRYPREGYHSKGYLCYYKNGELISEKLIRDEIYKPQKGIVMEGTETLGEGMVIPENEVEIIPPQEGATKLTEVSVKRKISQQNPPNLCP